MADEDKADSTDTPEEESLARERGWTPKDEWKGKPEYWQSAKTYLERDPKTFIPKLEKKIGQLEGKLAKKEAETEDRIKRLEGTMRSHYQAQIDRIKEEYEGRKRKAVETGDTEAYDKAVAGEQKAVATLEKKVEAAEDKQELKDTKERSDLPPETKKRLESFLEDNPWYSENRRLQKQFDFLYAVVEEDMPSATIAERLDEARDRLIKDNPEKFGKKRETDDDDEPSSRRSRVESGSRSNGSGPKKKGWSDIDPDDRRLAESMIGEGKLFKDKADYASDYWKSLEEEARA